jgi:hypothetical protein
VNPNTQFCRLFERVDYIIEGAENLPAEAGHIFVMNHLANHPEKHVAERFPAHARHSFCLLHGAQPEVRRAAGPCHSQVEPPRIRPPEVFRSSGIHPTDISVSGDRVLDCGDFASECQSGYTFPRGGTQIRSTADQTDTTHEWVYIVYDPSKPGTEVASGTSFGTIVSEDLPLKYHQTMGSQSGIYFIRLNGADGSSTTPKLIDSQRDGQQFFPDISADQGSLHVMWWDSRLDPCYSRTRPVANCADKTTDAGLDVFATVSNDGGDHFAPAIRVTDVSSNPTYEQFSGRTVPFAGDYLYITSRGAFSYAVWTDWHNTVQGTDPRESPEDADAGTSDVMQCRTFNPSTGTWGSDTCPHAGGLDQNIYDAVTP